MSKNNSYEDGIKQIMIEIRNQLHQYSRKNRFQIQEITKYDFETKSNLLFIRGNTSITNASTLNPYLRLKEIKRRFTIQPLKNNAQRSQNIEEWERKDKIQNKEKLMKKKKCEIQAWTILTTNQTD